MRQNRLHCQGRIKVFMHFDLCHVLNEMHWVWQSSIMQNTLKIAIVSVLLEYISTSPKPFVQVEFFVFKCVVSLFFTDL